ncbi:hypothetical protein EJ04DRAFT_148754 [Polyplosphaeria fusca]|uniref:Uncharacterized protein n=1 Tax=Polyplosphaeria fusca TaxID=682080 RepID=A0A9P4QH02_9PLEO|nr:hypothetical protein EJ04DRAFT_148754 [Polyplosphaeria fusca]
MVETTPPSVQTSHLNGSLPSWAQRLLQRPLVEIRRGISLDYDAPFEDCSVVALTAPSGRYVDVRFRLSSDAKSAIGKDSEIFAGYATAGTSTATLPLGTATCVPYECTVHVEWKHPIDSSASFTTDGADMYLLANGDMMEIGTVTIKGKTRMFKEYWIQPEGCHLWTFTVAETKSSREHSDVKGMAMVVGNYCQGILQTKDEIWVERWEVQGGAWVKDRRSNTSDLNDMLPCQWMIQGVKAVGDSTTIVGHRWEVVEV